VIHVILIQDSNPNLVPEAKETVELGLETRMFSNIILTYLFTEQEQTVDYSYHSRSSASGFTAQYLIQEL
jgi:hypothetical protein